MKMQCNDLILIDSIDEIFRILSIYIYFCLYSERIVLCYRKLIIVHLLNTYTTIITGNLKDII